MVLKLLLYASFIALLVLALYRSNRAPADPGPDARVIHQLRLAGSDLTLPHVIDFFLHFPDESSARTAARQLQAEGDIVTVEPGGAGGRGWSLHIARTLVPDVQVLARIRQHFEATARTLKGAYDGWGAGTVR